MYPTKEGSRFDCPLFPASGRRREDHYDVLAEGSWPHHVLLSHAGRLPVGVDHSPRIRLTILALTLALRLQAELRPADARPKLRGGWREWVR